MRPFLIVAGRRFIAAALFILFSGTPLMAYSWITHSQRLHDPAGTGGDGVEIEAYGGGYMYLANHISPYLLPQGFNRRPVLIQTDSDLKALAAYTYIRPNEDTTLYTTQLFLESTDFYKTSDNGFIICGNYLEGDEFGGGGQEYGAFLLKLDGLTLAPQWFRQYPAGNPSAFVSEIRFHSVVETLQIDGTPMYAIAGQITTGLLNQALVAGFDGLGNPMWAHELKGFNGGFGTAHEIIVYDANTLAVTGFAQGGIHVHCGNFQAHGDVLVARFQNDGVPIFVGLYGQSFGVVGGESVSFSEWGASLTRPTGSPDLIITGGIQAWSTLSQCPGGPAIDNMLTFRITPAGAVVWANRYGLTSTTFDLRGVQIKPVTAFMMIAANGWSIINNVMSENVAFFRLTSNNGALAQQTEIFGGDQYDDVAGIIPLGPPYPMWAVMVGASASFGSPYLKPYVIERMPSARRRCADQEVFTTIVPTPLPMHEVIDLLPVFPMRSQPLTILLEPVTDQVVCRKSLIGDLNGNGVISATDIAAFVLALTNPAAFPGEYPEGDIEAGDINDDGLVSPSDISGFVQLLTGG